MIFFFSVVNNRGWINLKLPWRGNEISRLHMFYLFVCLFFPLVNLCTSLCIWGLWMRDSYTHVSTWWTTVCPDELFLGLSVKVFADEINIWRASQVALVVKNPLANAGGLKDLGSVSGGGRSSPLQYSCLENPMSRGAWQAAVPRVAKSWTRPQRLGAHSIGSDGVVT